MQTIINSWGRTPSPTEILANEIIIHDQKLEKSKNLIFNIVDIFGNHSVIYLNAPLIDQFLNNFFEVIEKISDLTPDKLKFSSNEHKLNWKLPTDKFQIQERPKFVHLIKHIKPCGIKVSNNMVGGCLDYNAYVLIKLIVEYESMDEGLQKNLGVYDKEHYSKDMDLWLFLTKPQMTQMNQSLRLFSEKTRMNETTDLSHFLI